MRKRCHPGNAKLVIAMVFTMIFITGTYVFSWSFQEDQVNLKTTSSITIIEKEKNHTDGTPLRKSIWKFEDTARVVKRTESVAEVRGKKGRDSPKQNAIWQDPATGTEFVWIPGGCFKMGSPPDELGRDPDEGPVHDVCLDGFWMGKTEVTNHQYRKFEVNYDSRSYRGRSLNGDNQPVVSIT